MRAWKHWSFLKGTALPKCSVPQLSHYSKKLACFHFLRLTLGITLKRLKLTKLNINIKLYSLESHNVLYHFVYALLQRQLLKKKVFLDPLSRKILHCLPDTTFILCALFYQKQLQSPDKFATFLFIFLVSTFPYNFVRITYLTVFLQGLNLYLEYARCIININRLIE